MTLSAAQYRVLLAAAASPLEWGDHRYWRTDAPAALAPDGSPDAAYRWRAVEEPVVRGLANRGLLRGTPTWMRVGVYPTDDGLALAEDLRSVLGSDKRRLLQQIDEAGELVRRDPTEASAHVPARAPAAGR